MAISRRFQRIYPPFFSCPSLLLSCAIAAFGAKNLVVAQPITPANDGTGTAITQNGNEYLINGGTQSGNNLFHSFEQFGLSSGDIANFVGTPELNNILGRVTGGNISVIEGLLQVSNSNANLYLLNPAGLVFGADAQLDLNGSFTATTATGVGFESGQFEATGVNNYSALVGNPTAFNFGAIASPVENGIPGGSIINLGNLRVNHGQNISLVGRSLFNTGTLSAPEGQIAVVAVPGETSQTLRYTQPGMILGLELMTLDGAQTPIDLPNIAPTDLPIYLTGNNAINSLTSGSAVVSGAIDTASLAGHGGDILITGALVKLIDATVEASGKFGGGNIRIGGDYQGGGTLPTATNTFVNNGSAIAADAEDSGHGGEIIVWADNSTYFQGTATARGGFQNGDGGLVETSGKIFLDISGASVETTAPQGATGLWLLDPSDISIQPGGVDNNIVGNPNFQPTAGAATSILTEATLETALASNNVTVTTAGTGAGSGDLTLSATIDSASGNNLTLTSRRFIFSGGAINLTGGSSQLTFNINSIVAAAASAAELGQSIADANNAIGTVNGGTTLNLGAGTYEVASALVLNRNVTLAGAGSGSTIIQGAGGDRLFTINSGTTVNIQDLRLTGGNVTGNGGAIDNTGTLSIFNSELSNNTSTGQGGAIYNNNATLSIDNSVLRNNIAGGRGGAIRHAGAGSVTIRNGSLLDSNQATPGGGAVFFSPSLTASTLTVENSTVSNNTASAFGGGLWVSRNLMVSGSTFLNNTASGSNGGGIFQNLSGTNATTITSTRFVGNQAPNGNGGAIAFNGVTANISNSIFTGANQAQNGGAIDSQAGSNVTLTGSTISGNSATTDGGGINTLGTFVVENSTISGNTATNNGGGFNNASGTATLVNVTLSGNASGANTGGGIYNAATLNLANSVVANSTSGADLFNTATVNGTGQNLVEDGSGAVISALAGDPLLLPLGNYGGAAVGDVNTGTALIETHFFAYNSPIRNVGDNGVAAGSTDQRGGDRLVGTVDLGAVELQPLTLSSVSGSNQSTVVNTNFANPLSVRATESGFNNVVAGVPINFQSPTTGASTNPGTFTSLTNATGETAAIATANTIAGNFNLTASSGTASTTFNLTNTAGAASILTIADGNEQTTTTGSSFPNALTVKITDQFGNPVAGQVVTFQSEPGLEGADAIFDSTTSTTNTSGLASVTLTANETAGSFQVRASNANTSDVAFDLSNAVFEDGQICPPRCEPDEPIAQELPEDELVEETEPIVNDADKSAALELAESEQIDEFSNHLKITPPAPYTPQQTRNILASRDELTDTKTAYITLRFRSRIFRENSTSKKNNQDSITDLNLAQPLLAGTKEDQKSPLISQLSGQMTENPNDILEAVITTADGTVTVKNLLVTRQEFKVLTQKIKRSILRSQQTANLKTFKNQLDRDLQEVYQHTFKNFEGLLQAAGVDNLLLSLGTDLRSLPWDAIYDGEAYLVERYSFGITPSLSLTDTTYRPLHDRDVLVMGASKFNEQNALPAVPTELQIVSEQVEAEGYFLNEQFTRENLLKTREKITPGIIHLATHANFRRGDLSNSYIQLWADERLLLSEMEQLQWFDDPQVELLVLSACETALGDPQAQLGFGGLAVKSGVRSAIASLWSVSDVGTLALMTEFYANLRDPNIRTKAEALQQAKIALIRGEIQIENNQISGGTGRSPYTIDLPETISTTLSAEALNHPFFWSPFTLIGSPW